MNKNQKIIAFVFAALIAASIIFAPHHAEGTGEMMFRPLGTKEKIPFSKNTAERARIEEMHAKASQDPDGLFRNLTLDQFSRKFYGYAKDNPKLSDVDFTAGFYGWPVPNYTFLGGFWVIVTMFSGFGILATKEKKKA